MFLLVGKKMLSKEDIYYIKLQKQSVSGLNVGADVKYYGITIGKVTDISINRENISEIIVKISIREDTPIKSTSVANLPYQSIATGIKQIEITGGANKDPNLDPGSYIKAGEDMFENITGKAEIISEKIEILLNNLIQATSSDNRTIFFDMLSQIEEDSKKLDTLLTFSNEYLNDNKKNITSLIKSSDKMIREFAVTAKSLDRLIKSTNDLMASGDVDKALRNIKEITDKLNTQEFTQLLKSTEKLVSSSQATVEHLDKTFLSGRSNLLKSIELFKEALENINEFAILLKDNPDILIKGKESE